MMENKIKELEAKIQRLEEEVSHQQATIREQDKRWDKAKADLVQARSIAEEYRDDLTVSGDPQPLPWEGSEEGLLIDILRDS